MKRFCVFLALIVLSSSAYAGDSYSFVVAGHRIHIEAPRHCRSASCVSVSIPGIYRSRSWRDRDDEVAASPQPAPVNPPASATPPVAQVAVPASPPPVQPVASVPPPAPPPVLPAPVSTTQTIAPPPPPKLEPVKTTEPPPVVLPKPIPVPVPVPMPEIAKVSQEIEDAPLDKPLGDWRTEANTGTVRIERCGQAMCGYILNLTPNAKGDTILINMKPKSDAVWSGNIYSRSSGNTYYATMTMKGINTLRVEACVLGRFFCSGNDWTRIGRAPKLMTFEETSPRPPS